MADSRPMSRRGRSRKFPDYEESGLAYNEDILPYSNIDYIKQEEVYYKRDTPVEPERPKTSHGRRQRDPASQPAPSGEQKPAQPESSRVQVMRFDAPQSEDDLHTENWVSGDTYNPEQWTDGDTYRSDQWTDADPYPPEQGTETDPYPPEQGTETDPYPPEQGTETDPYPPEQGTDPYPPEQGTETDPYPPEQGTETDLYPPEQGTETDPYPPEQGTETDPYPPEQGTETDHYPPEQGTETDPYTQDNWTERETYRQEKSMRHKTYPPEPDSRETWDNDNQETWRTPGEQSYRDGLSLSKQYADYSPSTYTPQMTQPSEAHSPSSKRRQRNRNGKRHSEDMIMQEVNMRPTSSLTKYRPLPSIGTKPAKSSHQMENIVSSTSVLSVSDAPREHRHRNRNKTSGISKQTKIQSAMTDDWPVESDASMPQESHHHKKAYSESQRLDFDQPELSDQGQSDQPYFQDVTQVPVSESKRYRSTEQFHSPEEQTNFTLEQFEQNELQGQQAIESFQQAGAPVHQSFPQSQQYEVQAHQAIQEINQTKQEVITQFFQAPEKNKTEFCQPELLAHQSVLQFHQTRQEAIPQYSPESEKYETEFHQPELVAHQSVPQFHQARQEAIPQYSPAPEKDETEFHQPELAAHQSVPQLYQARQEAISKAQQNDKTEHRRRQKQSHQDKTQIQEPTAVQQDTSADVKERVPTEEEKNKETREVDHKRSALMRKINKSKSDQEQQIQGTSMGTPTEGYALEPRAHQSVQVLTRWEGLGHQSAQAPSTREERAHQSVQAPSRREERAHQSEQAPSRREGRRHREPPSLKSAAKQKKNLRKSKTDAAARNSPSKKAVEFTPHSLSLEPSDKEDKILLAVKLPSGQRCQRFFRPSETIDLILKFAENSCSTDLSGYLLVNNMPRVVFESRTQAISDASLKDRTVLYLEEREAIE